jgi:hypothetical protein
MLLSGIQTKILLAVYVDATIKGATAETAIDVALEAALEWDAAKEYLDSKGVITTNLQGTL